MLFQETDKRLTWLELRTIDWCKDNFKGSSYIFSEGNSTLVDYSMIINCDHKSFLMIGGFTPWSVGGGSGEEGHLNNTVNSRSLL